MKPLIYLVEDDQSIGYMLAEYLKLRDFQVEWLTTPSDCLEKIKSTRPDLFILDVTLPEMDGFQLGHRIRESYENIPLIFLTARSLKIDVLKGFSMGADDYIIKPVDEEELIARIRAVLKRYKNVSVPSQAMIQLASTTFYADKQELNTRGEIHKLTRREAQLLNHFFTRPEELITAAEILNNIWGKNDFFNRRSMDVFISRLRKKLENDPNLSIDNIHGQGFILKVNN